MLVLNKKKTEVFTDTVYRCAKLCVVCKVVDLLTHDTAFNAPVKFDLIVRTVDIHPHESCHQWLVGPLVRLCLIHSIQSNESLSIGRPIDDVEPRNSISTQLK